MQACMRNFCHLHIVDSRTICLASDMQEPCLWVPGHTSAGVAPDVDGGSVLVAGQQQLRRAVPARDHVLRHEVVLRAAHMQQP